MYVKKEELRDAVARLVETMKGQDGLNTLEKARRDVDESETLLQATHSEIVTRLAADPKHVIKTDVDHYNDTLRVHVRIPRDEADMLDVLKRDAQAKRERLWALRSQRSYVPTSLRELEAWLVRLDNDVKTRTVNVKAEFAKELGLI